MDRRRKWPEDTKAQAVAMYQQGKKNFTIARALGVPERTVGTWVYLARKSGVIGPHSPNGTGHRAWAKYRDKGAAPGFGSIRIVLDTLTLDQVDRLLALTRPEDATLAHTLARLVKEKLDAQQD